MVIATPAAANGPRFEALDALRGLAMLWMTAFHLCFDLNQFGYLQQDFYRDPRWTWQRTLILSLFLFCAGFGQAIALAQGQAWSRFWRRWALLVGAALLVSLGSWLMYPGSFIYFGVLHGLALMLLIARLSGRWGALLWLLGGLAIAMQLIAAYALQTGPLAHLAVYLNAPAWNWLGLITRKPITEDYVPLLPWLGLVWWGVAAGARSLQSGSTGWRQPLPAALRPLATLGRWSLPYYLLHQPLLLGGLLAWGWLRSPL
jgi:uncharacterized membrane protein